MEYSIVKQAITLSNQSTDLVSSGCYMEAINSLTTSLGMVKQALFSCREDEIVLDQAFPTCIFVRSHHESTDITEKKITESKIFVFKKPIYILSQSSEKLTVPYKFCVKLCFILLYNLALAHHLQGDAMNLIQDHSRALALYEIAYGLNGKGGFHLSGLVALAIANNMAMVHFSLQNDNYSRQCLQHLLSTIMVIQEYGCLVDEMEGFLSSVLPLILTTVTASAA